MPPAPTTGGPACTTIYFDGTKATDVDAVAADNINAAGEGFTLSAWVLRASTAGSRRWERIIDFGNGENQDNLVVGFDCGDEGEEEYSAMCYYRLNGVGDDWGGALIPSYQPFPPNQWVSVQLTHASNGDVRIYWDGVEKATANNPLPSPDVYRSGLFVGHSHWGNPPFHGQMQDLFVFNTALSPGQLANLRAQRQFPTIDGLWTQPIITAGVGCPPPPTQASAYFTVEGPCTVDGACVRTPNYPNYGNDQTCTITPRSRPRSRPRAWLTACS